jgi:hypothetical protein
MKKNEMSECTTCDQDKEDNISEPFPGCTQLIETF